MSRTSTVLFASAPARSVLHRLAVLGAIFVLATSLAACGGSDDDAVGPTTTTTAQSGATDPETSTSTDQDAVASGDLVAWVDDMCVAAAPAYELTQSLGEVPSAGTDPTQLFTQMQSNMSDLGTAFEAAAQAIGKLGPVPVDNGGELRDGFVDLFHTTGDAFESAAGKLAGIDMTDPESMQEFSTIMGNFGTDVSESVSQIQEKFDSPALSAAFDTAPSCKAMS